MFIHSFIYLSDDFFKGLVVIIIRHQFVQSELGSKGIQVKLTNGFKKSDLHQNKQTGSPPIIVLDYLAGRALAYKLRGHRFKSCVVPFVQFAPLFITEICSAAE